jgi:hypothetical protein
MGLCLIEVTKDLLEKTETSIRDEVLRSSYYLVVLALLLACAAELRKRWF